MKLIKQWSAKILKSSHLGNMRIVLGFSMFCVCFWKAQAAGNEEQGYVDAGGEQVQRYQIAKFNYDYVGAIYPIVLWVLLGSLAKLG